jgi:hypothetical protein
MLERVQARLNNMEETTRDTLKEEIEQAVEFETELAEMTRNEADLLGAYLQRDLAQTGNDFNSWSEWIKTHSSPNRVQSGFMDLTAKIAESGSGFLERLSEWANSTGVYHTGEMAVPGAFKCRACEGELHFESAGTLPPCPTCSKTEFRRVG